jgi:TrpR family trp operon transcriptional repressor
MDKYQKGWDGFIELCLSIKDKKACSFLFDLMLTPEEKHDLATRLLIVKELLKDEKTQRDLAKDLNVSIAKITRGSNELKRLDRKLLMNLKEILRN